MAQFHDYKSLYSLYRDAKKYSNKPIYNTLQNELMSDRSSILYSSAFRRLSQKAQVFSMETNSNVRSRLTHSLEVADLGIRIANGITHELREREENTGEKNAKGNKKKKTIPGFKSAEFPVVAAIVENACLMHDIGNPPFGHFGEAAIQDWAKNRAMDVSPEDWTVDTKKGRKWIAEMENHMKDFEEFDGNPQGFRVVTRLLEKGSSGLTCATLLCALKYARTSGETKDEGIKKKAGYFWSEEPVVRRLMNAVNRSMGTRYPLTYIMEAADDISYCMSDIADSIEKRILTEDEFVECFCTQWEKLNREKKADGFSEMLLPREITAYKSSVAGGKKQGNFNRDFAIKWAERATDEAVANYVNDHDAVYAGMAKPLMSRDGEMHRVLETIGMVCREKIYTSIEAESIELTGYAVISGILRHYERLLKLPFDQFMWLVFPVEAKKELDKREANGEDVKKPKLDIERRLYNRLSKSCVDSYIATMNHWTNNWQQDWQNKKNIYYDEWWFRVHLLIDHISSMTDAFALETYQMLEGIALMRT